MGIRDELNQPKKQGFTVFGCDTETYNNPTYGLKSIQLWNPEEQHYFITNDYNQDDDTIRWQICKQFIDWINERQQDTRVVFFNMDFDFSQFAKYLICDSGLEYYENIQPTRQPKNTIMILESEFNIYKCQICNRYGYRIIMLDIANFLTATTLNKACLDWIGEQKVDIESKDFLKAYPTAIEKEYAMQDARLTQLLYCKLELETVTEGHKYVTIAGRTIGHFKDFLKSNYHISFNMFAWGTDDKDTIAEYQSKAEELIRPCVRGGICQAVHTGYYPNAHHIDARSMYPTQMYKPLIPHGPILDNPPETGDYNILHFPKGYLSLKPNKIPYLQFRKKSQCIQYSWDKVYNPSEYVESAYLDGTFCLWDEEYKLMMEIYDVYEWDDSKRYYIAMVPNTILKSYIEILYKGKLENTGTIKYYYKILLNALYGKFLSRPDGVRISYANHDRTKIEEDNKKTYYIPLGSWIAMNGRVDLMRCMLSIPYDNVLYCDTDSCIYIGNEHPNVTMGKWLGEWGIENDNFEAFIVGPKTYQERNNDGTIITKCAGLSNDVRETVGFMDIEEGKEFNVIKAKRDKDTWAINLRKTTFKVSLKAGLLNRRL